MAVGDGCVAAVVAEGVGRTPREPHAAADRASNARAHWARRVATCAIDDSGVVLLSLFDPPFDEIAPIVGRSPRAAATSMGFSHFSIRTSSFGPIAEAERLQRLDLTVLDG